MSEIAGAMSLLSGLMGVPADPSLPEEAHQNPALAAAIDRLIAERALEFYEPYPKQAEFHTLGRIMDERLLMAANQVGKFLHNDTPVLTPTGWTAIGNLRTGDQVIAGDGSVTTVMAVYPQGVQPLYRLTFDRGESVLAGGPHLWRCLPPKSRYPRRHSHGKWEKNPSYNKWVVLSTDELLAMCGPTPLPRQRALLPVSPVVQFPEHKIPLDPYFVGLMLGDGCTRNGTVMLSSADQEIRDVFAGIAAAYGLHVRTERGLNHYAVLPGGKGGHSGITNPLMAQLRELGIAKKLAHEKYVPSHYLWNTPDVRLAVLQGLLDTDGSVEKNGTIEFSTTSARLAQDVTFLVQSFGGKVGGGSTTRRTCYTYKGARKLGRPSWRLRIRLPQATPFRLARKKARLIRPVSTCDERVLWTIEKAAPGPATCITVAHPSQTFLIEHFLVTHNTVCASRETAYHATGKYPDWWEGHRFTRRTVGWTGSPTGQTSRDTVQRLLLGRPGEWGTGAIPAADIVTIKRAAGSVPDQVESITVRCVFGGESTITLKTYDQGRLRWQGETIDYVWYDEEPPLDVYSEGKTRTQASKPRGVFVYMTFTPMLGASDVVIRFTKEKPQRSVVVPMTIHDAKHYTEEERARIIAGYPAYEREARALGIPIMGTGRVFTIPEEDLRIEPIAIPAFWYRFCGMDFGWDHPTANAWMAWDKDNDVIYVYAVHSQRETTPIVHAAAIKAKGSWIPVFWPHDGLQHDKGSGVQIAQQYKAQGVNMWRVRSTHAPIPPNPEGSGGFSVEAGIQEMIDRMQTGRLKVFRTCSEWFEEYRTYHREKGLIVKERDDLMSATRIGIMMRRFAKTIPEPKRPVGRPFVPTDKTMGVLG